LSKIKPFLTKAGLSQNHKTVAGHTPLHFAAARGYIQELLDITGPEALLIQDVGGFTPLDTCIKSGHFQLLADKINLELLITPLEKPCLGRNTVLELLEPSELEKLYGVDFPLQCRSTSQKHGGIQIKAYLRTRQN